MKKNSISNSEKFLEAAKKGEIKKVAAFLESGIDLNLKNEEKQTALHLASEEGHLGVIKFIALRKMFSFDGELHVGPGISSGFWASIALLCATTPIEANKKLIEFFEKKIKDVIDSI